MEKPLTVKVDNSHVLLEAIVDQNYTIIEHSKQTVQLLETINQRQHKENKVGFWLTMSTFIVTAGLAYTAIHLEVFDKQQVKSMLNSFFNVIFSVLP